MRKDIDARRDEIEQLLLAGTPQQEIARILNCKVDSLISRLKRWDLQHLKNPGRRGQRHQEAWRPSADYTVDNGPYISSHNLRLKLLRDGIKKPECEICGTQEWMGKPTPLELDHINGNHYDNRLENLRIICPNCHAQTPTNSRRKSP